MRLIETPSPNHGPRPPDTQVDVLVLHYTGMVSATAAIERLCDPAAQVSAHYLIDEDGTVHRLVDEPRRAWHAGRSYWRGRRDINDRSIGIELVNPGHDGGYPAFAEAQMAAAIAVAQGVLSRHPIPARNVVGHSDIAPDRKIDPGERFDWARLAAAGIGLWPAAPPRGAARDAATVQSWLRAYGYDCPLTGTVDRATVTAVAAFQRHFHPTSVTGTIDAATCDRLAALLVLVGALPPDLHHA